MTAKPKYTLYTPGRESADNANFSMLVADLRNAESKLCHYKVENGNLTPGNQKTYSTNEFSSFSAMVETFKKETGETFSRISAGVPGPVIFGRCETTHLPWSLDSKEIENKTGADKVYLINDMEAMAYSLGKLEDAEVVPIHSKENFASGNVALLAPGNGLGEAGLFWDGSSLRPFATEGGHTEFSPRTEFEVEFYHFLNKIYGIVSWENVLSKDGIYNIYRFLRDVGRHAEDKKFADKINSGSDFLDELCNEGKSGNSRLVNLTLEMYADFLAREANYLALKLKATGGLVISGEVTEKLRSFINKDKFYSNFKISDKMENLLKEIPIYFIFNNNSIIDGAAFYGAFIEK